MADTELERLKRLADELAEGFSRDAAERDARGGTPKAERDALRRSGLLALTIPSDLGGLGRSWTDTLDIVRRIARADASVAHVFGFQHLLLATVRLFGDAEQWRPLLATTARARLFWGNALNPLDRRTTMSWDQQGGTISGEKSFCSGARDSDMLVVSALDPATDELVVAALPTRREGIDIRDDWDNIGQRQTDSGSVRFDRVRVQRSEILASPGPLGSPFASLRPCIAQLIFANVYLGIAAGALAQARGVIDGQHAWFASGVDYATDDPYVLRGYGELFAEVEAARAITDEAAVALDAAYARGEALTPEERGRAAVAVALAKVKTTRVSLETTSRIFELMGARSTAARARLDRFWRNARTLTLHDPVEYKLRELGVFALAGTLPRPTFYS